MEIRSGNHEESASQPWRPVIYAVDDDPAILEAVLEFCRSEWLEAVVFDSAEAFEHGGTPEMHSIVLLDIRLPGRSGLEILDDLGTDRADLCVLIMSGSAETEDVAEAFRRGAVDFLDKSRGLDVLFEAVRSAVVLAGGRRTRSRELERDRRRIQTLTPREIQVMSLLITGLRNKAIALQLGISAKTVDVHRNRIMKKTQARSFAELVRIGCARAAAAARAVNRGLLSNMHDSSAASNDDAAGVRPAE